MSNVLVAVRREFPEFEVLKLFDAAIPAYFLNLKIEVLEQQDLSNFEQYILHAVSLDVNTISEIARLLGIDERDLLTPAAHLLKEGYIVQNFVPDHKKRVISLSPKGVEFIKTNKVLPTAKIRTCKLHFNSLTWQPCPLEEKTFSIEDMNKKGMYIIPPKEPQRPTIGDLLIENVAAAIKNQRAFKGSVVNNLMELKSVDLQYIAPVTVIQLQNSNTGEERLVIYRNDQQLSRESIELQRLYQQKKLVIPYDATLFKDDSYVVPLPLPAEVSKVTQALDKTHNKTQELETEITVLEERRNTTQNTKERQEFEERIKQYKEELLILRSNFDQLSQQLSRSKVEFLKTEQHRPLLEKALHEAREEIIIISPWMNTRACNDSLCRLFGAAINRGVKVRIGYGMGKPRDAREADRNRNDVRSVKYKINQYIDKSKNTDFEMIETIGTHQKILVCDRSFAISGSFNWLSYVGELDANYRNETGTLFRDVDQINKLAEIALNTLGYTSGATNIKI